jgi:hypothetical protein
MGIRNGYRVGKLSARAHARAASLLSSVSREEGERLAELCDNHVERGMLNSEILLAYSACRALGVTRLIESGRWLGHSTLVLSRLFHGTPVEILSIDLARTGVAIECERRLRECSNVRLFYGDSFKVLPGLLARSTAPTAILMDGPKGAAAVQLMQSCMDRYTCVRVGFLHDAYLGSEARAAISESANDADFTDDPAYVSRFSYLDGPQWASRDPRDEYHGDPLRSRQLASDSVTRQEMSYGPTLALIMPGQSATQSRSVVSRSFDRVVDEARCQRGLWEARLRSLARAVRSAVSGR